MTTGIESDDLGVPLAFKLQQNHPNPFNPSTTISYTIVEGGEVQLKIYNALGYVVKTFVQGTQPAGEYSVVWDAMDAFGQLVASGLYFYQLKIGDLQSTRRMILLK